MSAIFSSIVDVEFDKFLPVKIISVRFNQPLLVSRPALTTRAGQRCEESARAWWLVETKIVMMERWRYLLSLQEIGKNNVSRHSPLTADCKHDNNFS